MTWNYRLVESQGHYAIREVYYKNNKITTWTQEACWPIGESIDELKQDMAHMLEAFELPVLREEWDDKRKKHRLIELL